MQPASPRYRPVREIGRGRCAVVFEAEDTLLGRRVALKQALDGAQESQLLAEARRLARVHSPFVVQLFDVVRESPAALVLELLHGETLRAATNRDGRMALRAAAPVVEGMLAALDALHAADVVHGDLKPENIWLAEGGGVKLLDVGVEGDATALYAAPELEPASAPSTRTDVYAAATVAWELLTGRPPFDSTDAQELARRKRTQSAPTVQSAGATVPAGVEAWLARGLAVDPALRFASARAALAAWREAVAGASAATGTGPEAVLYPELRAQLERAMHAVRAGRGQCVVAGGAPGAGKTTLLAQAAHDARRLGFTPIEIRPQPSRRRTPWSGWRDAVHAAGGPGHWCARTTATAGEARAQEHVLRALGRAHVILADDPVTLDGPTRRLVLRLAAEAPRRGDLVVIAVNASGAGQTARAVREALGTLAPGALQLTAPDDAAWRAFLAAGLETAQVSDTLAAFVTTRSQGNPRLALELLAELRAVGALRAGDAGWIFRPDRAPESLPAHTAVWLSGALAGIRTAERALLRAAAVAGPHFDVTVLAAVVQQPVADVEQCLHTLARERGAVQVEARGWAFQPPPLATLLREEIAAGARAALHRAWAQALEDAGRDDAAIGHHWAAAGEPTRALPALERSGQAALERGDAENAARDLELACRIADSQVDDEAGVTRRATLGVARARALHALAAWDTALEELDQTATLARAWGQDGLEMLALRAAGQAEYARHHYDDAIARYVQAQECALRAGNEIELHELALQIGNVHFERGDLDAAAAEYGRVLESAAAHADAELEARASNNFAMVESIQGRKERAIQYFDRSLRCFVALGRGAAVARLLQNIGMIYLELGNFAEARNFFRRGMDESERTGEHSLLAVSCLDFAEANLKLGAPDEAAPAVARALAICNERGDMLGVAQALRLQAQLAAAGGNAALAEEMLMDAIGTLQPLGQALHLGQCWKDLGEIRLQAGRRDAARMALAEARRRFESLEAAQHVAAVETLLARCQEDATCP